MNFTRQKYLKVKKQENRAPNLVLSERSEFKDDLNHDLKLPEALIDIGKLGDTLALDQPFKSLTTKNSNAKPDMWRDLD